MATTYSNTVKLTPTDRRCRYWAIRVADDAFIPSPAEVGQNERAIGTPLAKGEHVLRAREFLIQGQEVHHSKHRGWTYSILYLGADGNVHTVKPTAENKSALKAAGMSAQMLKGAGQFAACIRLIHGLRGRLDAGVEPMMIFDEQVTEQDYLFALSLQSVWFVPAGNDRPTPGHIYKQALQMKFAKEPECLPVPGDVVATC